MKRLKILMTAAAFAAGIAFSGGANAAAVAPVKVQAKAVEAMSPLGEVRHRKWHRKQMRRHRDRRYDRRHHDHEHDSYRYGYGYESDRCSYNYAYGCNHRHRRNGLGLYFRF